MVISRANTVRVVIIRADIVRVVIIRADIVRVVIRADIEGGHQQS